MQRWPAVPTAANTIARTASSRSADRRHDHRVVAAQLEQRAAEARRDRAADRAAHARRAGGRDQRRRADRRPAPRPTSRAAEHHGSRGPSGTSPKLLRAARARQSAGSASAVSGVFSDGFHTTASPQTSASAAFHAHTATGKLNALMTPTTPERMPGLHHAVAGPLGGDGEAVELARQADGEVADVDHLLHLAQALLRGSCRPRSVTRRPSACLVRAQLLAEQADQLAALRRRHQAPGEERGVGGGDRGSRLLRAVSRTRASSAPSIGERAARAPPRVAAAGTPSFSRRLSMSMP